MGECPRCGEETGNSVHSNEEVGFRNVCNLCQQDLHSQYAAEQAARRAAALAPPPSEPSGKGSG